MIQIFRLYKTCHSINCDKSNPYHREDRILYHIILVLKKSLNFLHKKGYKDIFLSCLYHDIGKVYKYEIKKTKKGIIKRFEKHWYYSANIFINRYYKKLNKRRIYNIYKSIALHHYYKFKKNIQSKLYLDFNIDFLKVFNPLKYSDSNGRISDKKIDFKFIYNDKLNQVKYEHIINEYDEIRKILNKYADEKIIILPIGAPASGKSFLYENYLTDFERVSLDIMRVELYNKKHNTNYNMKNINGILYDKIHSSIDNSELLEYFFKTLKELRDKGKNIYIDNTNINQKYRTQIISQFGKYKKIAIFFLFIDYNEIKRRNNNRKIKLDEKILKKYYFEKEIPLFAEGFDEIIVI